MRTRQALLALLPAALVLAVAGCTAAPPPPAHPFAAELEDARKQASNPEIAAALADDVITDEEVARARQIAIECFEARGISAHYDNDNSLTVPHPDGAKQADVDAITAECAGKTFDLINPLKEWMEYNPTNTPLPQMRLDCYKRTALVEESMTVDQFLQIDQRDPPWGLLDGDAWGCDDDPLNYQGGRADLTPAEAGYGTDIDGNPVP